MSIFAYAKEILFLAKKLTLKNYTIEIAIKNFSVNKSNNNR